MRRILASGGGDHESMVPVKSLAVVGDESSTSELTGGEAMGRFERVHQPRVAKEASADLQGGSGGSDHAQHRCRAGSAGQRCVVGCIRRIHRKEDDASVQRPHLIQKAIDADGLFDQQGLKIVAKSAFHEVRMLAIGFDQITKQAVNALEPVRAFEDDTNRFAQSLTFLLKSLEEMLSGSKCGAFLTVAPQRLQERGLSVIKLCAVRRVRLLHGFESGQLIGCGRFAGSCLHQVHSVLLRLPSEWAGTQFESVDLLLQRFLAF